MMFELMTENELWFSGLKISEMCETVASFRTLSFKQIAFKFNAGVHDSNG